MESVGELLRKEREAQGKSIADVARATKLTARNIEALEEDRFSALPGQVYVRGHLKTYARFLRLNEDEILAKYLRLTQQQETTELDEWDKVELELHEQQRRTGKAWIAILIAVVVVVVAVFLVSKWKAPSPGEEVPLVNNELRQGTGADPMIDWSRLDLMLVAKERVSVRVSVDGAVASELTLEAGERRRWEADERLSLDASNGGALEIYVGGTYRGTAGSGPGPVENLVITERGILGRGQVGGE